MAWFDLFSKKKTKPEDPRPIVSNSSVSSSTVPDSERKFYQQDSYYTESAHPGTMFEQKVITFEERKKSCIPSRNGLFVAEILLLEYCRVGTYPSPRNGYPGFWWFKYGIRDVGLVLESLLKRGYVQFASVSGSVDKLTLTQLKEILGNKNISVSGKKADLVKTILLNFNDEDLINLDIERKYELTDLGTKELEENEYVPYMHRNSVYTDFTIWDLNKEIGNGDKSIFLKIIEKKHGSILAEMTSRHEMTSDEKTHIPSGVDDMVDYQDFGSMVADLMPKELTSDEEKFFSKWFRKFHLNNNKNANLFREHSKKIGLSRKNFRDALWAIGQLCLSENNRNILNAQPRSKSEIIDLMVRNDISDTELFTAFLLEEIDLQDTSLKKNRSLSNAVGQLEKLVERQGVKLLASMVQTLKIMKSIESVEADIQHRVINYCDGLTLPKPQEDYLQKLKANKQSEK